MLRIIPHEHRVPLERVRELCLAIRAERQWTQGQLARRIRVKRKMIESIEQQRYDTAPAFLLERLESLRQEG